MTTTGDVPDLLRRYWTGGPEELSRATGGVVTGQSAGLYMTGKAKFLALPAKLDTIRSLSDALGFASDNAVLLAFGRSCKLRISDEDPLMVRELRLQAALKVLDDYPDLVAAKALEVGATARALAATRRH